MSNSNSSKSTASTTAHHLENDLFLNRLVATTSSPLSSSEKVIYNSASSNSHYIPASLNDFNGYHDPNNNINNNSNANLVGYANGYVTSLGQTMPASLDPASSPSIVLPNGADWMLQQQQQQQSQHQLQHHHHQNNHHGHANSLPHNMFPNNQYHHPLHSHQVIIHGLQ